LAHRFVSVLGDMKLVARLIKILSGARTDAEQEVSRLDHFAHFCVLVGKSFVRNRCPVRAAALSYATLLALIPMLAVAIGVTSSILKAQGEKEIYAAIDKVVSSIMPPATSKTDSHGSSLNLTPISITVTRSNSVVSKAVTNSLEHTAAAAQPGKGTVGVSFSSNSIIVVANPTNAVLSATTTDSMMDTNGVAGPADNPADGTPVVSVNAQKEAAKSIHEFVQNTQSGALGVIGTLLLVVVAIRMLANIEATFNDIWGVPRGRPWLSRVILYWTTITLGPLLMVAVVGLASSPHFLATKGALTGTFIGGLIFDLLPLVLLWLLFALVYLLVPNTKVSFSAALFGGIVGGSLWHLNNVFGFLYASRVVSYSKIYGSLGLVPVFMAGLYFSWLILLFGAQIAYAFQNRRAYLQDKLVETVNQRGREFVALRLMTCIGQRFQNGLPPVTLPDMTNELGIPTRLAQHVLQMLLSARLIVETGGREPGYAPARPLGDITAHHILHALRSGGGQELPMRDGPVRAEVLGEFARIEEAEFQASSAISMLALVNRAQTQLELAAPQIEKTTSIRRDARALASANTAPPLMPPEPPAAPKPLPESAAAANEPEGTVTTPIRPSPARRPVTMPDEEREFPL
jgi:membrane protein